MNNPVGCGQTGLPSGPIPVLSPAAPRWHGQHKVALLLSSVDQYVPQLKSIYNHPNSWSFLLVYKSIVHICTFDCEFPAIDIQKCWVKLWADIEESCDETNRTFY